MAIVDLEERMKMTFLTLDYCDKEETYAGKVFHTGTVATDVLNIPEDTVEELVRLTDPMMMFVDGLYHNNIDLMLMERSRQNVFAVVDLLRDVPPFSYHDFTWLDNKLASIFSEKKVMKASRTIHQSGSPGAVFVQALGLVAQLGFGIQQYRQVLIPLVESLSDDGVIRNSTGYAQQFAKFFTPDDYTDDKWMVLSNVSLHYIAGEKGLVKRMHYASFPSMFRSNLFEALSVSNAPRMCPICGRFFLTTKAYPTMYCSTPCPGEEHGWTCAVVASKMGGKYREDPAGDLIQRIFERRRNTLRKYMREGKLPKDIGETALKLAERKRTKARLNSDYAVGDYEKEMEQDAIVAEAMALLKR